MDNGGFDVDPDPEETPTRGDTNQRHDPEEETPTASRDSKRRSALPRWNIRSHNFQL